MALLAVPPVAAIVQAGRGQGALEITVSVASTEFVDAPPLIYEQNRKHNIKDCTEGMHFEKTDPSNPTPLPGVLPQKPATVASDVNILNYGT